MASRRYRGRNSLNGNVTHSNARLSSIEKRSIPTTISAGAIDGALLAESSVTSLNLAPGSVQGENIATGAVNTGNLADASVTSAKLAPDALAGIEVGENAVDTVQLVDGAVTNIKIRDGAINNAKITSLSGSKINEGTVASTYIADLNANKITAGTLSIDRIPVVDSKVTALSANVIGTGDLDSIGTITADVGKYANTVIGFHAATTRTGIYTGDHIEINSSSNISANTSVDTAPFCVYDGNVGVAIDSNQINTIGNINLYLNGNGSVGNVILGDGGGNTSVTNKIVNTYAYNNGVTTPRAALYVSSAGVYGFASSTVRVKQDVVAANLDAEAILSVTPKYFRYIQAVEELGDAAPVEVGFIAEELLEAGLDKYVFFDDEGLPKGVHYEFYVTALQTVARSQATQISELQSNLTSALARLDALEAKVN